MDSVESRRDVTVEPSGVEVVRRETFHIQTALTQQLQSELENLTLLAVSRAKEFLMFGTAEQKIAITRTLLGGAMKIVGSDLGAIEREARVAIDSIWEQMRDPNANAQTALAAADHSD